eukprot:945866-Prorocentrum_minimum.AAC.6
MWVELEKDCGLKCGKCGLKDANKFAVANRCTTCEGDGKVRCFKCGGAASRQSRRIKLFQQRHFLRSNRCTGVLCSYWIPRMSQFHMYVTKLTGYISYDALRCTANAILNIIIIICKNLVCNSAIAAESTPAVLFSLPPCDS